MQKLFLFLSVIGMVLTGCNKNDDDNNENEGKLPDLPVLPDPDDVCSAMDDINFMAYCYNNFDVNKDGKVSFTEARAVKKISYSRHYSISANGYTNPPLKSVKGIEYFSGLEQLNLYGLLGVTELNLGHNYQLNALTTEFSELKTVVLPQSTSSITCTIDSFGDYPQLSSVICYATAPPECFFADKSTSQATLYVPEKSIQVYKESSWSQYFKDIQPIK